MSAFCSFHTCLPTAGLLGKRRFGLYLDRWAPYENIQEACSQQGGTWWSVRADQRLRPTQQLTDITEAWGAIGGAEMKEVHIQSQK